jgi:6-phosphogluconolactonase (cycloisomerase 2 family)
MIDRLLAALVALGTLLVAVPTQAQFLTWIETEFDEPPTVDGLSLAQDLAVSPDGGKHVYIASEGDGAVATFSRDAMTGALTFLGLVKEGFDVIGGLSGANDVIVSPDGKHVYAVGPEDDAVVVFTRDATTGALTLVEVKNDGVGGVSGLSSPHGPALSPDGKHLYVACFGSTVVIFSRNADTGALTFVGFVEDGEGGVTGIGGAQEVVVSPDGQDVYVAGDSSDAVAAFRRNAGTGLLTIVEAEVDNAGGVDGIDAPFDVAIAPDGAHVYVPGAGDHAVAVFARNAMTGALDFLQVVRDGSGDVDGLRGAFGVAVSPDGTRLYAVGGQDDALAVFDRAADGLLTFREVHEDGVAGVEGLGNPNSVKVSPDGLDVYTSQRGGSSLAAFRRTTLAVTTTSTTPPSSTTSTTTAGGTSTTTTTPAGGTTSTTTAAGGTTTTTLTLTGCPDGPVPGCRTAARGSLFLRDRNPDARDRLVWKWSKGGVTTPADLGDPRDATSYRVCIYDRRGGADAVIFDALAPAGRVCGGRPCWASTKKGFRYLDRRAGFEGLLRVKLKAGAAGKAAIAVVGRGAALVPPTLPLVPLVTVQLHAETGACWETEYGSPRRNTSSLFRAD